MTSRVTSQWVFPGKRSSIKLLIQLFYQKVRERHDATPSQSGTLEVLVTNEKSNKVGSATEGLMWLLRSLAFTGKSLQQAQSNPSEDLKVAFTKGYNVTLGPIHRGSGIFSIQGAIMRAAGLMFNVRQSLLSQFMV